MNTSIMLQLQKEILWERQDAHVTAYKVHKDTEKWKQIQEFDIDENRRLGIT